METSISVQPIVLDAAAVAALPARQLDAVDGVAHRILWSNDESLAGVLTVAGGHRLGAHAHHENHHHIWVLEGQADILKPRSTDELTC